MIERVKKRLAQKFPKLCLTVKADNRGIVTLAGQCESWRELIDAGHTAAKVKGVKNVVSEMTAKGVSVPKKNYAPFAEQGKNIGVIDNADVVIVGAGVTGCAIARELAKFKLNVTVIEMTDDVATGASKANNGNIHAGHAAKPGTLKAKLNIEGNRLYTQWSEELGFELQRCGALGVAVKTAHLPLVLGAYAIAKKNGVDGVRLVSAKTVYKIEPKLRKKNMSIKGGLWLPSFGLVEPYEVVVALAENAAQNGVRFLFNTTVADLLTENGRISGVVTNKGIIGAQYVINCAGVYADEISLMAGDNCYTIHPRKGTIVILDKNAEPEFDCLCEVIDPSVLKKKNSDSKGGGMCRTPERNILLGPSATETPDKEDTSTTPEDLAYSMGRNQNENVSYANIIRIFAGVRPADFKEDFVIGLSEKTAGFINCGAIQSPGLAAAPAIAKMVSGIFTEDWLKNNLPLEINTEFNPRRPARKNFRRLSHAEQAELIAQNPAYGRVICRCETITEGEILDAIHSPIVPSSIDAIKRRTRAGMGRCQGGFCQPRVLELLAREKGADWITINMTGEGTNVLVASTRPQADKIEGVRS